MRSTFELFSPQCLSFITWLRSWCGGNTAALFVWISRFIYPIFCLISFNFGMLWDYCLYSLGGTDIDGMMSVNTSKPLSLKGAILTGVEQTREIEGRLFCYLSKWMNGKIKHRWNKIRFKRKMFSWTPVRVSCWINCDLGALCSGHEFL